VGLDYMVWRRYDPALGRFLGVDPMADSYPSWSPYNYTLNNPVRYTDPDGQCPVAGNLFCIGVQQGFEQSLTNTFEGIKGLFTDFSGTMSALGHAISNPGETLSAIGEGISERVDMATSGNPLLMGQVAGEAVALTGEVLLGAKGAGLATKSTRTLKTVDNVSDVTIGTKTLTQQADNLVSLNNGKNRVTLRSENARFDVDLRGKAHFDKVTQSSIPTPHVRVSQRNFQAPNQPVFNTGSAVVRPATQQDIRMVRRFLERQNR
jgi:hypothetical protein